MIKELPLSVIVPVYKTENYLERCIRSILVQDYEDFELILIDDGSPDACGEICERYGKTDSRVRVLHQKNAGVSAARNAGIELAEGKYLCFIDSDDWVEQNMFSFMMDMIEQNKAQAGACSIFSEYKNAVFRHCPNEEEICCGSSGAIKMLLEGEKMTGGIGGKFVQRSVLGTLRFPEGHVYEDTFFVPDLLLRASKTVVTTKPLYHYTKRRESTTGRSYRPEDYDLIYAYEYTRKRVLECCPENLHQAQFRVDWGYFMILDKMLAVPGYRNIAEYGDVVTYLRKRWMEILKMPWFGRNRKIGAVALRVNVRLYRLLLRMRNVGLEEYAG